LHLSQPNPRLVLSIKTERNEAYLLDDTLSGTDHVLILEVGYTGSAFDLMDCSLKLGLPNSHQSIGFGTGTEV